MDEWRVGILATYQCGRTGKRFCPIRECFPHPAGITHIKFRAAHHDGRPGCDSTGCRQEIRLKCGIRSSDDTKTGRIAGNARHAKTDIQCNACAAHCDKYVARPDHRPPAADGSHRQRREKRHMAFSRAGGRTLRSARSV